MRRMFPSQVTLDPGEVERINRVRLAKYYHKLPHEIDAMPAADFEDTLQVIWADDQK